MWDKLQTGLKNNIALGTNTTIAKYFTFSLGANIDNALTTKTVRKYYDPIANKAITATDKGVAGYSTFRLRRVFRLLYTGRQISRRVLQLRLSGI